MEQNNTSMNPVDVTAIGHVASSFLGRSPSPQDSCFYGEALEELNDLVLLTLEKNGVLAELKSLVRYNIEMSIEKENFAEQKTETAKKVMLVQSNPILTGLVVDFLRVCGLEKTLGLLSIEANIKEQTTPSREQIASQLELHPSEDGECLLSCLLSNFSQTATITPSHPPRAESPQISMVATTPLQFSPVASYSRPKLNSVASGNAPITMNGGASSSSPLSAASHHSASSEDDFLKSSSSSSSFRGFASQQRHLVRSPDSPGKGDPLYASPRSLKAKNDGGEDSIEADMARLRHINDEILKLTSSEPKNNNRKRIPIVAVSTKLPEGVEVDDDIPEILPEDDDVYLPFQKKSFEFNAPARREVKSFSNPSNNVLDLKDSLPELGDEPADSFIMENCDHLETVNDITRN